MKITLGLFVFFLTAGALADAQVAPEATAGAANFQYALRYSQSATFLSNNQGTEQRGTVSGSLDYANGGIRLPFSAKFGGGYNWIEAGTPYGGGFFENLGLSQGMIWSKTRFTIGDDVSYRRQTAVTGFSGIQGTGEPVGGSGDDSTSSESILNLNTSVVNNVASVGMSQIFNYATSLDAGASMELLRFPDGNGRDLNSEMGNAGITRRLNARNSLTGSYQYSQFGYPGEDLTFTTNSAVFGGDRRWNRHLSTNASAGPEWISSTDSSVVPSSLRISGNAGVNYLFRSEQVNVSYRHGTSGGSGYLLGAELDTATVEVSRPFGRAVTVGFDGSYRRTSGLANNGVTNGKTAGAQATWRLSRSFTAFAGYTAVAQSSSSALSADVLSGLVQTISFGIGYSPRKKRVMGQ